MLSGWLPAAGLRTGGSSDDRCGGRALIRQAVRWITLAGACPALASTVFSCVPADTMPERGAIEITVSGDESILSGIPAAKFADGWTINFERVLVYVGRFSSGSYSSWDGDATV